MGTFSGEATLVIFILVYLSMMVSSSRKEFAPVGANSFLKELTSFWKGFVTLGSKQEVIKVVSLCKHSRKTFTLKVCFVNSKIIYVISHKNLCSDPLFWSLNPML